MKIIERYNAWKLKRTLKILDKTIDRVEATMKLLKYTRQQRRGFWRDFVKKSEIQKDVFLGMLK
jgi:hypothetical protein